MQDSDLQIACERAAAYEKAHLKMKEQILNLRSDAVRINIPRECSRRASNGRTGKHRSRQVVKLYPHRGETEADHGGGTGQERHVGCGHSGE